VAALATFFLPRDVAEMLEEDATLLLRVIRDTFRLLRLVYFFLRAERKKQGEDATLLLRVIRDAFRLLRLV
jgi:hypothetical protein